ncbi:MAG: hypothetical protein A2076_08100 [Geobacteraceae bacterium GWC2_53_11]|nr:MAG: hypothetical protein A2076_08100 [Geobacteraceae bacterium GWC2_53_11]
MATKIKIIAATDFLEVTTEGTIDITTSRQLLTDIAHAGHDQENHKLIVDFRGTQSDLTIAEVYQLAAELCQHGTAFRRDVALIVTPGLNFDRASFFETCSHNRGFSVNAYTDYETALRWILQA